MPSLIFSKPYQHAGRVMRRGVVLFSPHKLCVAGFFAPANPQNVSANHKHPQATRIRISPQVSLGIRENIPYYMMRVFDFTCSKSEYYRHYIPLHFSQVRQKKK